MGLYRAGDDTTEGVDSYSANYIYFQKISTTGGGEVQKIVAKMGQWGIDRIKCAIYTDDTGAPGVLVANSETDEVTGAMGGEFQWAEFYYSGTKPQVSAGTDYWIAVWTDTFFYSGKATGGSSNWCWQSLAYGSFPATASPGAVSSFLRGIYLSVASGLSILEEVLPIGNKGTSYSESLSAMGGTSPYTYELDSGDLPWGLTLGSDGVISGTPTESGDFEVDIKATDSLSAEVVQTVSLHISALFSSWKKLGKNPVSFQSNMEIIRDFYKYGETYYLYNEQGGVPVWGIYVRTSSDGISWGSEVGPLYSPGGGGSYDENGQADPSVIYFKGQHYMFFDTKVATGEFENIAYGTSEDCLNWTKQGVVLSIVPDTWESHQLHHPAVVVHDGKIHLFYCGSSVDSFFDIGLATSEDGVNWERCPLNPVLPRGDLPYTEAQCRPSKPVLVNGLWCMWYWSYDDDEEISKIVLATSENLINWTKRGPDLEFEEDNWNREIQATSIVKTGGELKLYAGIKPDVNYYLAYLHQSDDLNLRETIEKESENNFDGDPNCKAVWDFNDGGLTTDSKGGNTLTDINTVGQSVHCKQGSKCAVFERSNSESLIIEDASLQRFPLKYGDTGKKISVCFWVRFESFTLYNSIFGKYSYSTGQRSFQIAMNTISKIALTIGYNGGASYETAEHSKSLGIGVWYHVGVTFQDSDGAYRIRIWDDKNKIPHGPDKTGSFTNNIDLFNIPVILSGCGVSGAITDRIDGMLDEVVVFDRVLAPEEIDLIRDGKYKYHAETPAGRHLSMGTPDGTILGQSPNDKISFFGNDPIVQPAGHAECPAGGTGTDAGCFRSAERRDQFIALLNAARKALVDVGLMGE